MSDVFIPFNNQPYATTNHASTYTVLAGEYAKITVSYFQDAYVSSVTTSNTGSQTVVNQPNKNQGTLTFWAKSGDVILTSSTNASGTDSGSSSTFSSTRSGDFGITVNGATILYFITRSTFLFSQASISAYSVTHSGFTDSRIFVERYKELT